jgi:hypothetical protein
MGAGQRAQESFEVDIPRSHEIVEIVLPIGIV